MLVLTGACCLLFACCLGNFQKKNLANSKLHNQTNFNQNIYVVPTFYNVVLLYRPILPRGSKVFHIVQKIMDYGRMKSRFQIATAKIMTQTQLEISLKCLKSL